MAAITYWGISDRGAWLGAPIGLLRADGSRKPAYEVLDELINDEWWLAPTTMRTDAGGRVQVTGAHGDYQVRCGAASATFALTSGSSRTQLVVSPVR